MRTFENKTGQKFDIEINVPAIKRIEERTGFRLQHLFSKKQSVDELDFIQMADIICALVEPEAHGLSEDEFMASMDLQQINDAFMEVMMAYADFMPAQEGKTIGDTLQRAQKRADVRKKKMLSQVKNTDEDIDKYLDQVMGISDDA